jgi:hypothetical protein
LFACFGSFIVKLAEFLLFYFPKPVFWFLKILGEIALFDF